MQTSTSLNLFRRSRVGARAGLGGSQVTAYESWSTIWVDKVTKIWLRDFACNPAEDSSCLLRASFASRGR